MKTIIRKILSLFGLELRRAGDESSNVYVPYMNPENTMDEGLGRVRKIGIVPSVVIDLGAAAGTWSIKAVKHFPESDFLLFEPLEERKQELVALCKEHPKFTSIFAAAGSEPGVVSFHVSDDLDGSGVYDKASGAPTRDVELVTIDQVLKERGLKGPILLKFDTHGFEIPILEGAKETLKNTEVIIMECYGFKISSSALLMHEMVAYLAKFGFRLSDIVDVMRRPGDAAFWQCDIIFIKDTNPIFKKQSYS